ncbi:uncharacterized protein LOC117110228 isoform X2 [Anneissia japonica]|uniref:uncharacterized protein LOC117110228 isoform X2 n=1 Tax=Anneissia japonica TaxID=1529436 RepID=UPI001425A3B1|nr:uncharacterized protein LOC117110228 isoform X2 [Anneissia japonica]
MAQSVMMAVTTRLLVWAFITVFLLCKVPQGHTTTAPVVKGPGVIILHLEKNATINFTYELSTGRVLNYIAFHRFEDDEIGELMVQSNKENPNGRFSIDTTSMMMNNSFTFTVTDVQQEDDGLSICIVDDGVENGRLFLYLVVSSCTVTSFVYKNLETTCKSDCYPTANVSILVNSVVVASGLGSATTLDLSSQTCMKGSGVCVADNGIDPVAELKECEVMKSVRIGLIVGITVGVAVIGSAIAFVFYYRSGRRKLAYRVL